MASASPQQILRRLTVIVALQWMGATLGLPLLPLFLERRGGTPSVIGIIMAAFFAAGVVTQFALGHLTDRYGRRPILIGALGLYGVASMTYLLPVSAPWFALTRAVQGSAAGAIEVASLSAVAALFAEHERGRAVSKVLAAQLTGIALGPVIGVVASVRTLGWAFFVTGLVSLAAAAQTWRTPLGDRLAPETPLPHLQWTPQVAGALVAACAAGLTVGVYEACWSLLMHAHHASTLQIRLSWTLFSIPWVLLSRAGGWLADHADRRSIAVLGLLNIAFFLALYPHIHNNVALLLLGSLEAVGSSLSVRSISSLLTQGAEHRELGRRQGLYATANTASLAAAALVSGYLFTIDEALPFSLMAAISASLAVTAYVVWRHIEGRVRPQDRVAD